MTPSTAEARRRIVMMLLREGRIGPGVAGTGAAAPPRQPPSETAEPAGAAARA